MPSAKLHINFTYYSKHVKDDGQMSVRVILAVVFQLIQKVSK